MAQKIRIGPAERLQRAVARGLARLPAPLQLRLAGEPPMVIDGQQLDPQVQLLLALRRKQAPPGLTEPTLDAARARYRRDTLLFRGPGVPLASVRDFTIPGDEGPLRVRHYIPQTRSAAPPPPLTVYLHGGGFVIGDLDTHDEPCRLLCREAATQVLSVEYRLAPEFPFPAALDDAAAALRWAQTNAADLGADAERVAVGGDSAGGNLAAVVSWQAAREGSPPAAQLLVYPATDSVTARPSQKSFDRGFFLDQRDRDAFTAYYLEGTGVTGADWRVSPLRIADLAGLPPALVVTAGFDLLRDEGEAYAAALEAAGSSATLHREPGHGHGFIHLVGISATARAAWMRIARDWRALLDRTAR